MATGEFSGFFDLGVFSATGSGGTDGEASEAEFDDFFVGMNDAALVVGGVDVVDVGFCDLRIAGDIFDARRIFAVVLERWEWHIERFAALGAVEFSICCQFHAADDFSHGIGESRLVGVFVEE